MVYRLSLIAYGLSVIVYRLSLMVHRLWVGRMRLWTSEAISRRSPQNRYKFRFTWDWSSKPPLRSEKWKVRITYDKWRVNRVIRYSERPHTLWRMALYTRAYSLMQPYIQPYATACMALCDRMLTLMQQGESAWSHGTISKNSLDIMPKVPRQFTKTLLTFRHHPWSAKSNKSTNHF